MTVELKGLADELTEHLAIIFMVGSLGRGKKELWSSGVSLSGDIQDPPGRGAVQPALGDPALAGGWAG